MDQIINDWGKEIDDCYASKPENKQSFRTDPSMDIQKISAVIPPLLSVMYGFEKNRSEIFHTSAQDYRRKEFSNRPAAHFM